MTAQQYMTSKKDPYDLAMVFHGAHLRSADSKATVEKDRAKRQFTGIKKSNNILLNEKGVFAF